MHWSVCFSDYSYRGIELKRVLSAINCLCIYNSKWGLNLIDFFPLLTSDRQNKSGQGSWIWNWYVPEGCNSKMSFSFTHSSLLQWFSSFIAFLDIGDCQRLSPFFFFISSTVRFTGIGKTHFIILSSGEIFVISNIFVINGGFGLGWFTTSHKYFILEE